MSRSRAPFCIVLVTAATLIAAGCGGSDSSTSDLTKTEFIARADAICKHGSQQIEQAAKQTFSGGRPTPQQERQFITQTVVPQSQSQIDQIKALGAPSGDEDQVNQILDAAQAATDDVKSSGDVEESSFAHANALAKQYGLVACSQ
jgi:hypothetical protein